MQIGTRETALLLTPGKYFHYLFTAKERRRDLLCALRKRRLFLIIRYFVLQARTIHIYLTRVTAQRHGICNYFIKLTLFRGNDTNVLANAISSPVISSQITQPFKTFSNFMDSTRFLGDCLKPNTDICRYLKAISLIPFIRFRLKIMFKTENNRSQSFFLILLMAGIERVKRIKPRHNRNRR